MAELVSLLARVKVGTRTYSINTSGTSASYRDLTESRTGKVVDDKQEQMLSKIVKAATSTASKLTAPTAKAAKPAKAKASKKAAKPEEG